METVTLNVKGMSCNHCVKAVKDSVGALDGVKEVDVNLEAGTVAVQFDENVVQIDKIKEAIEDQGYDVE